MPFKPPPVARVKQMLSRSARTSKWTPWSNSTGYKTRNFYKMPEVNCLTRIRVAIAEDVGVMVDGSITISPRQRRAGVMRQFELQMPKYPLRIVERLTNYRYRMFDEARGAEMLATVLVSSFDFYQACKFIVARLAIPRRSATHEWEQERSCQPHGSS